jgi:hypothetical protein
MACSCESCSSPRIIKTRTAMFWRWLAQSRGETAERVIRAPVRATVYVGNGLTDHRIPIETAVPRGAWEDEAGRLGRKTVSPAYSGGRVHEC